MAPRPVHVVPHTHWDREWYSPFQTFRLRLVDLLDDLLPTLDADPSYAHFLLDGQMAVVDDYLAVRPGAEPVLRRLATSGRLAMGPWYILMDEFLVSGETMIRDLQLGLDRAAAFGGAMEVGYLPDMFGHIAQMPQLLRQAGFEHAVVWRGVPSAVDRSGFWWEAPDGSTVRAEYLPDGYGNGARVPDDAKDLVARVAEFEAEQGDLLVGPILWMNGTDHLLPQPWLGRVVAEANGIQDDYELVVMSLAEHVRTASTEGLPTWRGELRSGARANLLMGVASNRVDVRQGAARAERALERLAEPLSALFRPAEAWPASLLREAWLHVVRNAAHDSVCACSVDEVCDAVLHRYAEARQIGDGLATRALDALGASLAGSGPVVVNPSSRTRGGLVEVIEPGDGPLDPNVAQLKHQRPANFVIGEFATAALAAGVALELEYEPRITSARIERLDGHVLFEAERAPGGQLVTLAARAALQVLLHDQSGPVIARGTQAPSRKVVVRVDAVPGFGWRRWSSADAAKAPAFTPVTVDDDGWSIDNGLVRVAIDRENGSFSVGDHRGLGLLVDDGDIGDTYNWCPTAEDQRVDRPRTVRVERGEDGPLRAKVNVVATYAWPARAEAGQRSASTVDVDVRTTIELHACERLVRVTHAFENRARDHRLRAWFPLPRRATESAAECAFAIVRRGVVAEGGPTEAPLATYPSRRFVQAGGLTIVHEGLLEYELVDVDDAVGDAGALALTLARCTGMLSQGPMASRPLPAGPMTPIEGPQLQGPVAVRYAVYVGDDADPYALADDAFLPLQVTNAAGGSNGDTAGSGQALAVDGAEVSAVLRTGSRLEVRVFNPSDETTTVTLAGRRGWLVDLRGRPVEPFDGGFPLGPWRFATAVLTAG
jgi:alpha-mannosidase